MTNEIVNYSDTALVYMNKAGGRIVFLFILLFFTLVFVLVKYIMKHAYNKMENDIKRSYEEEKAKLARTDYADKKFRELDEELNNRLTELKYKKEDDARIIKYFNIGFTTVNVIVCLWVIITLLLVNANLSFSKVKVSMYEYSNAKIEGVSIPGYYEISYKASPERKTLALFVKNTGKITYNEVQITEENGQVKKIVKNLAPGEERIVSLDTFKANNYIFSLEILDNPKGIVNNANVIENVTDKNVIEE